MMTNKNLRYHSAYWEKSAYLDWGFLYEIINYDNEDNKIDNNFLYYINNKSYLGINLSKLNFPKHRCITEDIVKDGIATLIYDSSI